MSRRPVRCVWATASPFSTGSRAHDHRQCRDLLTLHVGPRPSVQVVAGRRLVSLVLSADPRCECEEPVTWDVECKWVCPVHGVAEIDPAELLDAADRTATDEPDEPWAEAAWLYALSVALVDLGLDPFGEEGPAVVEWLTTEALGWMRDGRPIRESIHEAQARFLPEDAA